MSPKKTEKKSLLLEASFEDILVCNNKDFRPLLEVFVFEPENIDQKNLGTLFGILEVADSSEDSSYIVNYLLSVIKKEYFSKPKRASIESFEAALHKGNLALSKIAEHGNVQWIGKLNAIIAIIEKNNLHLTQAGNTSAFLFRSEILTNVSEGLSSLEAKSNPLKTFINVSSGRLEKTDKLIVTTESIFDIFSLEEIKKSILRFSKENFVQFLKTALVNELQKAAVLIIDLNEKTLIASPAYSNKKDSTENVFSQNAFQKEVPKNKPTEEMSSAVSIEDENIKEKDKNKNNNHIYIKEITEPKQNSSNQGSKIIKDTAIVIGEKFENIQEKASLFFNNLAKSTAKNTREISAQKIIPRLSPPKINFGLSEIKPSFATTKNKVSGSLRSIDWQKHYSKLKDKKRSAMNIVGNFKSRANLPKISIKKIPLDSTSIKKWNFNIFSFIAPNLSKIKKLSSNLNYQQRLYAILIILAIIIIPFFAMQSPAPEKSIKQSTQTTTVIAENPNQDKNLIRVESLIPTYSENDILKLINLNDNIFTVSRKQITNLQSKEATPIPETFGKTILATGMDNLSLIFIVNEENKILSYSPVSKKFQENILNLPSDSKITAIGTYLTYLYAVDAKNNQIYRLPRADEGFGEKANWLKDSINLSQTKNISLNDNIFIISEKNLIKLFRGAKQDFRIEETYHKIIPSATYAKPESENIFILDTQNSKITKIDNSGTIHKQYFNSDIEKTSDFSISEASNTAYVLIGNDIKTFNLN